MSFRDAVTFSERAEKPNNIRRYPTSICCTPLPSHHEIGGGYSPTRFRGSELGLTLFLPLSVHLSVSNIIVSSDMLDDLDPLVENESEIAIFILLTLPVPKAPKAPQKMTDSVRIDHTAVQYISIPSCNLETCGMGGT